jgi:hypothetical protein
MSATPWEEYFFWFIHYVWINALCSAIGGVGGVGGGEGGNVGGDED